MGIFLRCCGKGESAVTVINKRAMTMSIGILGSRHLNEVQKEFNDFFPFLKIEFFKRSQGAKKAAPGQRPYPHSMTISEARTGKEEGYFEFGPTMTVAEMEEAFYNRYGLSIQVFRKSGNLWLETTMTDKWTLGQQNRHGQEISSSGLPKTEGGDDYELHRGED